MEGRPCPRRLTSHRHISQPTPEIDRGTGEGGRENQRIEAAFKQIASAPREPPPEATGAGTKPGKIYSQKTSGL